MHVGNIKKPIKNEKNHFTIARTRSGRSEELNCTTFSRYAIFAGNIIFVIVGICSLALGAWLRTDSKFRDFLGERYRQVVHEEFWNAPTLYLFSYQLIVLGSALVVVAVFGCCGTLQGSHLLLGLYGCGTMLMAALIIFCCVYLVYAKDAIDVELSDALNYMVQHYYQGPSIIQESLDRLQQAFRCCGNAGCSDFQIFRRDVPRTCDIRCDGCQYRIMQALRIGFSVALVVYALVVLTLMCAGAIAFHNCCNNENLAMTPTLEKVYSSTKSCIGHLNNLKQQQPHCREGRKRQNEPQKENENL